MPAVFPLAEPVCLDTTCVSEMVNLLFPWVWPKVPSLSWKGGIFRGGKQTTLFREPASRSLTLLWMTRWLLPLTASVSEVRWDWGCLGCNCFPFHWLNEFTTVILFLFLPSPVHPFFLLFLFLKKADHVGSFFKWRIYKYWPMIIISPITW